MRVVGRWIIGAVALVFAFDACGNRKDGSSPPPPGAPEVALVGEWPEGSLAEALAQRIRTRRIESGLPVVMKANVLASLDDETRSLVRDNYRSGHAVVLLDADRDASRSLAGLVGRAHGIALNDSRTPIVGMQWSHGHSRDDFVLHTTSSGIELEREVQAFLEWLQRGAGGTTAVAQDSGATCPDPNNLACSMDMPQQEDAWTDCVATWTVFATQFAFYACSEGGTAGNQFYVGLNFRVDGTVPSGYSWTEIYVPGSGFSPTPSNLSIVSYTPETSQTTTTVTTGTELTIGGGASFGGSPEGPTGSLSFSASDSFYDETTTEILSTDVQNLSSTENNSGEVLYQYQNFDNQCPGPYCYWAGHSPTCDKKNAECDGGYTAVINVQCEGHYPYECEYGSSPSDNTGGCGSACDSTGDGKNLCCPDKASVQNCATTQVAEYIWQFTPSSSLSCPSDTLEITANFNDDWPPACSVSSPTATEDQCGPTFATGFNTHSITYTVDLPAQCCSAECAPASTSMQATPTPVPGPTPGGSWAQSCTRTAWDGSTLCATCLTEAGVCQPATCITNCAGEPYNNDGILACGS